MASDKSARGLKAGQERRTFTSKVECRSNGNGGFLLNGYASTTEEPYDMYDMFGPYSEVISRGSFAKTLGEAPKVQLLVNHGGLSLAQTTSGTLRLSEDSTGLLVEADLNPKRNDASDLIEALNDGSVDEMSFALRVVQQAWSPDYDERRISEVNLSRGDVSVVNLGANPNTSVALRSADFAAMLDALEGDELRAAMARLTARSTPAIPDLPTVRGMSLAKALALIG